jgi:hypothetical protein
MLMILLCLFRDTEGIEYTISFSDSKDHFSKSNKISRLDNSWDVN